MECTFFLLKLEWHDLSTSLPIERFYNTCKLVISSKVEYWVLSVSKSLPIIILTWIRRPTHKIIYRLSQDIGLHAVISENIGNHSSRKYYYFFLFPQPEKSRERKIKWIEDTICHNVI